MSVQNSVVVTFLSDLRRHGRAALASSLVTHYLREVADETVAVGRRSRLAETVRWGERTTRQSWLYRWLTTEPESDVVVVDLRETMVVGPVLGSLDRLVGPLVRHWDRAQTGAIADRLSERFVARPVQVVSVLALAAVLANLLVLVALGSSSRSAMGIRLVAASLALAGTRVTLSADDLTRTKIYELAVALLSPPQPSDRRERDDRSSK